MRRIQITHPHTHSHLQHTHTHGTCTFSWLVLIIIFCIALPLRIWFLLSFYGCSHFQSNFHAMLLFLSLIKLTFDYTLIINVFLFKCLSHWHVIQCMHTRMCLIANACGALVLINVDNLKVLCNRFIYFDKRHHFNGLHSFPPPLIGLPSSGN